MNILGNIVMGTIMGVMTTFILVNVITGCEDWNESNCVTPMEMIGR